MRPHIEKQLEGRTLPLIMAHKGGTAYGRENSLEAIRRSLEVRPDVMIEVDVRKSRDGVLYCHHGSIPFGITAATLFFDMLPFAWIERLVGQRDTLIDVLSVVPERNLLYLDIKDRSISAADLRSILGNRKNIWIAPITSLLHLRELRAGLGEGYAYAYNRPVLLPRRAWKRIQSHSDFLQSFWWNWDAKTAGEIEDAGAAYHLTEWFVSRSRYIALMPYSRYRGLFFSIYDLADAVELDSRPEA